MIKIMFFLIKFGRAVFEVSQNGFNDVIVINSNTSALIYRFELVQIYSSFQMSLWPGDGIVASQCYSWIWLNLDVFQVKRKRKKNEPWTVTQAQRPVDKNGVFQTVAIGCLQ